MPPEQLQQAVEACGGRAFAAKQLADWLYAKRVTDLDAMTNLSKPLRAALAERYALLTSEVAAVEDSGEGTTKLALRLADGLVIECVLMLEHGEGGERVTACISTQAGCAMGCRFCASGMLGLKRHLTPGEILEQFYHLDALLKPRGKWLTNVVVMGMGEPLHNFDGLMGALAVLNAEWGFHFGARRVTVSTVGLPERIRELAEQGYAFNLAISLHATTDEQRTALIPTNKATGLRAIIDAAAYYFRRTRREVTFEYTLVGGQNDTPGRRRAPGRHARGLPARQRQPDPHEPRRGQRPPRANHRSRRGLHRRSRSRRSKRTRPPKTRPKSPSRLRPTKAEGRRRPKHSPNLKPGDQCSQPSRTWHSAQLQTRLWNGSDSARCALVAIG
jgi:23S rRNA (adenine2503-C2)-methyltransferase